MTLPDYTRRLLKALRGAGYTACPVGGCVRDSLLGLVPRDYDLCTSARPEETIAVLSALPGCALIPTGLAHGTVTALLDGIPTEITTFRTEGGYSDSRHPDSVTFVPDLEADLARRDFTVNAMALAADGRVIDPFGGQADLAAGVLRCVGEPAERFTEDALRILRALRFAGRYGFTIAPETAGAMLACRDGLTRISAERIFAELTGILTAPHAGDMLRGYPEVFTAVLPELAPMVGFAQHTPYHCWDVWTHTAYAVDAAPVDAVLRLTMLLHDAAKPACFFTDEAGVGHFYGHAKAGAELADALLRRLRCDNARREAVTGLIARHDLSLTTTDKGMRRLLSRYGRPWLTQLLAVQRADNAALTPPVVPERLAALDAAERHMEAQAAAMSCFSLHDLAVDGRALLALGYAPGPGLGRALNTLLAACVEGDLPNEQGALLARAALLLNQDKEETPWKNKT